MVRYQPTAPPGELGDNDQLSIPYESVTETSGQGGQGTAAAPGTQMMRPFGTPATTQEWCYDQFRQIARALEEFDITKFKVLNVAPAKPSNGNIAFADGTNWNPGAGQGFYEYRGGSWNKL